jgi:hypothetical protein
MIRVNIAMMVKVLEEERKQEDGAEGEKKK